MALNKKGITVTRKQYWKDWGVKETQAAISIAGFDKEIEEWIWERERKAFEMH